MHWGHSTPHPTFNIRRPPHAPHPIKQPAHTTHQGAGGETDVTITVAEKGYITAYTGTSVTRDDVAWDLSASLRNPTGHAEVGGWVWACIYVYVCVC